MRGPVLQTAKHGQPLLDLINDLAGDHLRADQVFNSPGGGDDRRATYACGEGVPAGDRKFTAP